MGRTNGSLGGTIYKVGDSWRGQIYICGKRRSVTGKTKKEVIQKFKDLQAKEQQGLFVEPNSIAVEEWVTYWLKNRVEPNIKAQSFIRIEAMFRNHIFPEIGAMKLQDLTTPILEETYAKVFREKAPGKKYEETNYSHSTVNALSSQFKKCLRYAVQRGILARNPHEGVHLHKLRPPKKISSYSRADQRKIIERCKYAKEGHRLYYFLISTGMRFGETAALTWDDIDLESGEISINKTAINLRGSMYIQEHPKTEAGNRTIYVGKNIVEWLKWHKGTQDQDANYRNLVFPNQRYNITNQANAILAWTKICEKLDIPHQGMHSLRHTWATRALEEGIDVKTVSKMLGHKNVITTMNIYQDVMPDQKIKAACTMDALF